MAAKRSASRRNVAADIDAYLAPLPRATRSALSRLRKIIRSAAPRATEVISYQIPTFKQNGFLVAFAAFPNHCSLFVGKGVLKAHARYLRAFDWSAATIHFTPEKPLPEALVRRLVRARIAENEKRRR